MGHAMPSLLNPVALRAGLNGQDLKMEVFRQVTISANGCLAQHRRDVGCLPVGFRVAAEPNDIANSDGAHFWPLGMRFGRRLKRRSNL